MTNAYGEYLDARANQAGNEKEQQYYNTKMNGEPITNDNDKELQQELEGSVLPDSLDKQAGDTEINWDSQTWEGMRSGAIEQGAPSTQTPNWLENVSPLYKQQAKEWAEQRGVIKVTPIEKRQNFTYSTIAYIAQKREEPKTQIFPISDLQVNPHQITWGFYDTTEGRIGVSHAVENHMICEFDVYVSELLATYWTFGDNDQYNYHMGEYQNIRQRWREAVDSHTYLNFEADIESQKWFIDFRNTFLQQHSGWVCRFASHAFGVFQGVISDVNYSIGSGESFAKWHVKIEEAIFTNEGYSYDGQKPAVDTSQDGSTENSGDAANTEDIVTE